LLAITENIVNLERYKIREENNLAMETVRTDVKLATGIEKIGPLLFVFFRAFRGSLFSK
jgi:hypothetical protein